MLDDSVLVSIFNSFASILPSLLGTLIGGGVTLIATRMTISHQNELEEKKRRIALENDWRLYQRENLIRLQEAVQHSIRATWKSYSQMLKHADAGTKWSEWIVDSDVDENQRQYLEEILLLSARLPETELNDAMALYREKTRCVTVESHSESQLKAAMNDLLEQYEVCMALLSERLRRCIGGNE